MGQFVGSGGRRPDPVRLEGLGKMSLPQTKKELRKLLGAFGYYRDYAEHFAHIVKPLTDLTSMKVPNQLPWEECHQRAYELLRCKLRSAHVLRIPKIGEPFVLHTDASGVAVGATLGQLDHDGVEHLLAFASHKLSRPQCAWSTIKREAYAIIWTLDEFRDIVYYIQDHCGLRLQPTPIYPGLCPEKRQAVVLVAGFPGI